MKDLELVALSRQQIKIRKIYFAVLKVVSLRKENGIVSQSLNKKTSRQKFFIWLKKEWPNCWNGPFPN